jgi:carboxyl-terminal processing protease
MKNHWIMLGLLLGTATFSVAQDLDSGVLFYINRFFDAINPTYLRSGELDWKALRAEALETARTAPKAEAAHAAIASVLETINDPAIDFDLWQLPGHLQQLGTVGELGVRADRDTRIIYEVFAGGPAERAGLRVGDELVLINGQSPRIQGEHVYSDGKLVPLVLKRGDQNLELSIEVQPLGTVKAPMHAGRLGRTAYLEPARGWFSNDVVQEGRMSTALQFTLRSLETSGACGYVFDFRRVRTNFMATISGLGPILTLTNAAVLTEVHPDGSSDAVKYEPKNGVATWGVQAFGSLYSRPWHPLRPLAPVAVLTGPNGAHDLPVAFAGRTNTRFFGEPQRVTPFDYHYEGFTDGAYLSFPAGVLHDRLGHKYDAPLEVGQEVATDWAVFGTKGDAVIQAAKTWLEAQPACK